MAGKRARSNAAQEPILGGIRVQTSLYGQTVPKVYGRTRVAGNLLWFGAFQAVRQEEQSEAAKGGSKPSRQYYSYSASVAMLLGEGPIVAVRSVWKSKQKFAGEASSARAGTATHEAVVPTAPYQVTVSEAAVWARNDAVVALSEDATSWPPYDQPLTEGVDYTADPSGVYTFASALAGRSVRITYVTSTATASVDALGQMGLSLTQGTPGQATWSYLTSSFPAEAVPYSGFAYVRGQNYPLTSAAEVENHNFEVDGDLALGANGDAPPWAVIRDMLCAPRYSGAQWPDSFIGDWSAYLNYCAAYGLLISVACTEQRATRDWIGSILEATNTDAAWDGSTLNLIPRGDENAGSYVAPVTPVFALSADDFLAADGEMPLRLRRTDQSSVHNIVRAQYWNRAREYNPEIVEASDEASIVTYGRNPEPQQAWTFFCDGASARSAVSLRLQRKAATRNQYEGVLPWRFAELAPGDLVTLTDADLHLVAAPARTLSIEEDEDDALAVVFEEFPIAHATAPIVSPQLGSGFRPDYNADPGNVAAPVFVEPPAGFTGGQLEVWAAISGQSGSTMWGGAEVYASLDGGTSYKLVGRVDQGARYGTLTGALAAGTGASLAVQLTGRGGQLKSVSAIEADAGATLAFIGAPASGEFVACESATLTGANAYTLAGLRRGLYGTTDQAAASGQPFVYVDGALAVSGPLPADMIGKQIKFKFCSFNVFGGGLQSLASAVEYSYTLTGRFRSSSQARSANMLPGATFDNGVIGPWGTPYGQGGTLDSQVTVQRHPSPSYYVSGTPSSVHLAITDAYAGTGRSAVWPSGIMTAQFAKRFCAFVGLIGWGTDAFIAVEWLDINLQSMGLISSEEVVAGVPVEDPVRRWNDPHQYRLSRTIQTAPDGARYARVLIVAGGTWQAGTKYLSIHIPYFGELAEGEEIPPFGPGPGTPVTTSQLARESATIVRRAPQVLGPSLLSAINTAGAPVTEVYIDADLRGCEISATATFELRVANGGVPSTLALAMQVEMRAVDTGDYVRGPLRTLFSDTIASGTDWIDPKEFTERFEVLDTSTYTGQWRMKLYLGVKGALQGGPNAWVSLVDLAVEVIKR